MKQHLALFAVALACMAWSACQTSEADQVLRNAHIVCLDGAGTEAQAMAVHDGRIVALGKEHEILNAYRGAKVMDMAGATIYPGLIDAHSHLLGYALTLDRLNLVGTASWEEVMERLAQWKAPGEGWVRGRGWDQNDWAISEFPTRRDLDALFPSRPVVLQRIDGHAVLANERALRETGMWEVEQVPGGEVLRFPDGSPSGVLVDGAADSLLSRIPEPSIQEKVSALKLAEQKILKAGLTTVTDAGLEWGDILLMDSLCTGQEICTFA